MYLVSSIWNFPLLEELLLLKTALYYIFQKENQSSKRQTNYPKGGPIIQKDDQLSKMRPTAHRRTNFYKCSAKCIRDDQLNQCSINLNQKFTISSSALWMVGAWLNVDFTRIWLLSLHLQQPKLSPLEILQNPS